MAGIRAGYYLAVSGPQDILMKIESGPAMLIIHVSRYPDYTAMNESGSPQEDTRQHGVDAGGAVDDDWNRFPSCHRDRERHPRTIAEII